MNHKNHIFYLTTLVLTLMFSYAYFSDKEKKYTSIQSYTDCVSSGYPIFETYPQTCRIPGKIFTNTLQASIKKIEEIKESILPSTTPTKEDYKNTRYTIEGTVVTLLNGTGTVALIHGSDNLSTISYFGSDIRFDANDDKIDDVAFLIKVQTEIGTTLYYLALALSTSDTNESKGANALFVGEDISPQSLSFKNNLITISYGEKRLKKQKTTVMKSKQFSIKNNLLVEN